MSDPELLLSSVEKTEKTIARGIELWRGSSFRRLIIILITLCVCGNPSTLTHLGLLLPRWYVFGYVVVIIVVLLTTIIVGARSLPRRRGATAHPDARAVRGLLPFGVEDMELFRSLERTVEIQRMSAVLLDHRFRFSVLIGPSGSGKTSFLRAALLPQLRIQNANVTYIELTDEDPCATIARTLEQRDKSDAILLIDQFEQFFLHHRTHDQRRPFVDQLRAWAARDSTVRVMISIRDEDSWQLFELQKYVAFHLSNQNCIRIANFSTEQAVDVLGILCEQAMIAFDRAFAATIVHRHLLEQDHTVSPATVGVVLLIMATRRQDFTPRGFKAHGGVDSLLDSWVALQLEAARFQGFERVALRVLAALCDFDHGRRGAVQTTTTLTRLIGAERHLPRVMEWLTSADVRLAARTDGGEDFGIQLAHERLIEPIRKIAGRIATPSSRANALLDRRVGEWLNNDRDARFLLPIREYLLIERHATVRADNPNAATIRALLGLSRARIWRRVGATLGVIALTSLAYPVSRTATVQRHYALRELEQLGTVYPSEDVARALACAGHLKSAVAVAHRIDYLEPDYTSLLLGQLAVENAKAGLRLGKLGLVDEALHVLDSVDPVFQDYPRIAIGAALTTEGIIGDDVAVRERGARIIETLPPTARQEARVELGRMLADAGLVDEALAVLETLPPSSANPSDTFPSSETRLPYKEPLDAFTDSDKNIYRIASDLRLVKRLARLVAGPEATNRADVLDGLCVVLGIAEGVNSVNALLHSLPERDRGRTRVAITMRLANMAVKRRDRRLLDRAALLASSLGEEEGANARNEIALARAALGRLTKNVALQSDARALLRIPIAEHTFLTQWKAAGVLGDHARARQIFNAAVHHYQEADTPTTVLVGVPEEMVVFALLAEDLVLQRDAVAAVDMLEPPLRPAEFSAIAIHFIEAGDARSARAVLEKAWQQAADLRRAGGNYLAVAPPIAVGMVRVGELQQAMTVVRATPLGEVRAEILSAVVFADAKQRANKSWAYPTEYPAGSIARD